MHALLFDKFFSFLRSVGGFSSLLSTHRSPLKAI